MMHYGLHPKISQIAFSSMQLHYSEKRKLFTGVNFDFPLESVIQIRGHLAAGASQLLKILAGLVAPTDGHYMLNGHSVFNLTREEFRPLQLAIGYGFDEGGLISNLTLSENLTLPLQYHSILSPRTARIYARRLMRRMGVREYADSRPALTSYGIRKAFLLARALILRPRMLVLDEPTHGLTWDGKQRLIELLQWHQQEFDLSQIVVKSTDEDFLDYFNYRTVEIHEQKLYLSPSVRNRIGYAL